MNARAIPARIMPRVLTTLVATVVTVWRTTLATHASSSTPVPSPTPARMVAPVDPWWSPTQLAGNVLVLLALKEAAVTKQ